MPKNDNIPKMTGSIFKLLTPEADPMQEEIQVCPFCDSMDTYIEKVNNHYPYHKCSKCAAGFYKVELRSACNFYHKAVTQDQCKSCQYYQKEVQCSYWNGILEPPVELKKEINKYIKKTPITNARVVA